LILQVNQLSKTFGAHPVIGDVSFQLQSKSATALIGPNGAGKTTILTMLAGLLAPTNGEIIMPNVKDIRTAIGFLPQYPQFFSWMTALECLELSAKLSGVEQKHAKHKAMQTLAFVGLEKDAKKRIGTFSGGMKQRLGIAQAIVHDPALVLLDEPVSALDPTGRRMMMDLLKELTETTTILYSTHILNDAEQITDQLLFLKDGTLVEQGKLSTIQQKYQQPKIVIEFTTVEEAQRFAHVWKTVATREHVYVETVNPIHTMQQVVTSIYEMQLNVKKLEHVTTSLEEIYMKVANNDESN
jgi:ABC-2 type transport system ATP-binding protein